MGKWVEVRVMEKRTDTKKLPVKDKVIYSGCMGLGNLLASVVFGYYLTYFYTDVVGLPAVIAGFILLGSRCFDAFTDFAMGVTIDRVTLKSGKYRGWLKIAIIPMFVGLPLVFLNIPGVSMKLKIVWAILTYGSYGAIFNTMAYVPSSAQLVNMTQNVEERASIIGIKEVFYNIGVVLVSSLFLPMVALFGNGSESRGFFFAALAVASIAIVTQIANIVIQKKYELNQDGTSRVLGQTPDGAKKESLFAEFKYLVKNKPALLVIVGILLMNILMAVKGGLMIYLFKYYFMNEAFYSVAMAGFTVASIVGALLIQWFVHLFRDSNRAFLFIAVVSIALNLLFFVMCKSMGTEEAGASIHFGVLFAVFLLCGLFQGTYYGLPNLLVTNTIDYGYAKTGKNQTGLIYGCNALSISLGAALGGFVTSLILSGIHYVPNAQQTPFTLNGMLIGAIVIPVVFMAVQLVLHLFYKIKDGQYARVEGAE